MLVCAVACIDDGNIEMASDEIGGAGRSMTHHQTIGLHGIERLYRVEKGLAFFYAGSFGLEVHGVRAQARSGGAEADARASGVLKEGESDGFATKGGEFF